MARAVQRSLISYLPTRKRGPVASGKDAQQQQSYALQQQKTRAATARLVESVQPASTSAPRSKRQRHAQLERSAAGDVPLQQVETQKIDEQLQTEPASDQHPLLPPAANETAQSDDEGETESTAARDATSDAEPSPPSPAAASAPTLPASTFSAPDASSPTRAMSSRPAPSPLAPSLAHADRAFLSREQRRSRDLIDQTVRDCLQPPPHLTPEPTPAQLRALIHPSAAIRPPAPRPPTLAAPSTPSKRRPVSKQPTVSSAVAALSASSTASSRLQVSPVDSPLTLPLSYRLLLSIFSALECAITVRSHASVLWSALSPAVVRIVQKSVALSHLQQLASVVPDCYELREERSTDNWNRVKVDVRVTRLRLSEEEREVGVVALNTSAASSSELAQRRQLLQQRLLDRALDEHERWYSTSSHASSPPFHPLVEGRWHADFPLDSLPPLPATELKGAAKSDRLSALDALESLSGHKRKWEEVEPLTPRSSLSRASSSASEQLLLTPSTRGSSNSSISALLLTPSTPFTAKSAYVEQFRRRAAAKQFEHADRATPSQLERLQHLGKLPLLLDVVCYCLTSSGRHMLDQEQLLSLVASGNPAFAHAAALRLQFDLLLVALPAAFARRSIGPVAAPRQLVGLTRRMGVEEMRAALKAGKDREEAAMREERRVACEALLRSVEGDEAAAAAAAAAAVEAVRVPHVASPAKRSLHAALMSVSPGGTERPEANNRQASVAADAAGQAARQLYR